MVVSKCDILEGIRSQPRSCTFTLLIFCEDDSWIVDLTSPFKN